MAKTNFQTIDEYIDTFPKDKQAVLRKLRGAIRSAAPKATEGISYQIPTYFLNGKYVVYFAGFKNHVSVYPAKATAVAKVKGLSAYKVSTGTLKFPLDKPIPLGLIKKFVSYRMKESREREKAKK
ncbi:MAG: DUF1801 domain-containing protein [Ignavibacteriae bacterium]|nr:DUF1801 domain-containing protein [Ignavibacteriota bacterium]